MSGVTIYNAPSGCNCDNKSDYTQEEIIEAATQALRLASQGQTEGRDGYPHVYNDYEHFQFQHAQRPYLEFPILKAGRDYSGGSPGPDRVIIGSIASDYSSAVYCAVITHDGEARNGFSECQDDTINPEGLGTYESKIEGTGEQAPGNRQLLERIDMN